MILPLLPDAWLPGIDVSADGQPGPLGPSLTGDLPRFAYVRALVGGVLDRRAAAHVAALRGAGIPVGVYGVPRGANGLAGLSEREAARQGAELAALHERLGAELLPAVDLEVPSPPALLRLTRDEARGVLRAAAAYLGALEAVSERPAVVYLGPAWWSTLLKVAGLGPDALDVVAVTHGPGLVERPLWLAAYPPDRVPLLALDWHAPPAGWSEVVIWQVGGDNGRARLDSGAAVDLDVVRDLGRLLGGR